MRALLWIVLGFCVSSSLAQATFVPEEEIQYKSLKPGPSNMDEAQFKALLNQIQSSYTDVVKFHGGTLAIAGDWKSEKLNAGATQLMNFWRVVISGALARRPELTPDGFTLIVCHELGHHLGGYSFSHPVNPILGVWAANEGQADYFATQVCARKLWNNEKEKNASFRSQASDFVKNRCDTAWNTQEDRDACYRISVASQSVAATMAALMNKPMPSFETPDPARVDATSDNHPAVQCRMDTSFQGAICAMPHDEKVIPGKKTAGGPFAAEAEREAFLYSCRASEPFGYRPACWFKQSY